MSWWRTRHPSETFPGSNSTYLVLDRYDSRKYKNVVVGTVEGILSLKRLAVD